MTASAQTTTPPPVLLRRSADGAIVHVMLNRPERRNALNGPMATLLADTIEAINDDEAAKVVIVRGAGGAFCSGVDLKAFTADPPPDWLSDFSGEWRRFHMAVFDSPKVIIGALERAAVNGGAGLAMACDLLVAGEQAFLQIGEISQGMAAPMNMAWLTLRHAESVAARLALVGDRVRGAELVRLGVAHSVVPDEEVITATEALAERIAQHEASGILRIKRSMRTARFDGSAQEWFDRIVAADPLASTPFRPRRQE